MLCAWDKKWVQFQYGSKLVKLQGLLPSPISGIKESSIDQVQKWQKGNDIWAVAMVQEFVQEKGDNSGVVPPFVQAVLNQFDGVFKVPNSLPPSREYDHTIALIPNASPVNSRPYRYSPL